MNRALLALLAALTSPFAHGAPDLGIKPEEQLHVSIVRTASKALRTTPYAALCLVGRERPMAAGKLAPIRRAGGPPCERFPDHGVTVKEFTATDFESSEWDDWGQDYAEAPVQKTLDATVPGAALHAAYEKVLAACREKGCRDYKLYVFYFSLHENSIGGRVIPLPLPELVPLKTYLMVPIGEGAPKDFAAWNLQLRITGKR